MRKKMATLILLLVLASISTITWALWSETLVMPHEASIPEPTVEMWLDGIEWFNGDECDWGSIEPSNPYNKLFTVQNNGVTNITASVTVEDLPNRWSLTWTEEGKMIMPNASSVGNLTLTVPGNITSGISKWNMTIYLTETTG